MSFEAFRRIYRRAFRIQRLGLGVSLAATLVLVFLVPGGIKAQDFGAFMRVADPEEGTVAEISSRVEAAIGNAGWTVLAAYDAGVDAEACSFQARVLVVDWPEHTSTVLSQGTHGAYAAPVRISVFEDELGVHVAAVNPQSLNRTIVAEEGMGGEWVRMAAILRRTLAEGVGAEATFGDFGQFRDKGRIGRTMGVMAGGPS